MADFWNYEQPIAEITEIEIPAWIESDISPYDVAAILQGGCASGAYMPAVTYWQALKTMGEHGDDVLQYLEDNLGKLPEHDPSISWAGLACHYLSYAVELWASSIESELEEALDELEPAE